jgi:hypoxanthine phosphoribosyltransferase
MADEFQIVYSAEKIRRRVAELGEEISRDYGGKDLVVVSVLKGSVVFVADLMRALTVPLHIDFIALSSLGDEGRPGGVVRVVKDLDLPVTGRDILIVEGIVDTGLALGYLVRMLGEREPRSLEVCTFLDRRVRRLVDVPVRYVGFDVPDQYLVGYGLDHRQTYRSLPYIALLSEEDIAG